MPVIKLMNDENHLRILWTEGKVTTESIPSEDTKRY